MTNERLQQLDKECNELFRKLDALKKLGRDKNTDHEYMQTLYTLRDKTRERNGEPIYISDHISV
jgi:hypothetical protein